MRAERRMPWARLDEHCDDNPKLVALSDGAFRLWVQSTVYCQRHLTDGFVTEQTLVGLRYYRPERRQELTASLIPGRGPLWHEVDGGIKLHEFLHWNDSKKEVTRRRKQNRKRVQKFRERLIAKRVITPRQRCVGNALANTQTHHTTVQTLKEQESVQPRARATRSGHHAHAFCGSHFCVSHLQHETLTRELGNKRESFDLLRAYEQWDREEGGAGIDNLLPWLKARINRDAGVPRTTEVERPFTSRELEAASTWRRQIGGCGHTPRCEDRTTCVDRFIRERLRGERVPA